MGHCLVLLLITTYGIKLSLQAGTTLGKLFVVTVPKMNNVWDEYTQMPQIYLYLFTNSPKAIE
ncbi:hypothetical protein BgiMline_036844, partial [Biomphalaria glabrata]